MHALSELFFNDSLEIISKIFLGLGGLGWLCTYILALIIGIREKTYAIPMMALVLNFAWEFMYGFVILEGNHGQIIINKIWCVFDIVIVYCYLRYGKEYFPKEYSKWFYPNFIIAITLAFVFQYKAYYYFCIDDYIPLPAGMIAYIMNVLMSVLFIMMLVQRKSTKGQSIYLALAKMIGTLLTSIALSMAPISSHWERAGFVIYFMAIACFVYDMIYIFMLLNQFKKEGKNPWKKLVGNKSVLN